MIQIGHFKFGFAAFSTAVVAVVLSACAIIAAFYQTDPADSTPLGKALLVNETIALIATLIYGVFTHFAMALIKRFRK